MIDKLALEAKKSSNVCVCVCSTKQPLKAFWTVRIDAPSFWQEKRYNPPRDYFAKSVHYWVLPHVFVASTLLYVICVRRMLPEIIHELCEG